MAKYTEARQWLLAGYAGSHHANPRSQTNRQALNKPPSTKATNLLPVNSVKTRVGRTGLKYHMAWPKIGGFIKFTYSEGVLPYLKTGKMIYGLIRYMWWFLVKNIWDISNTHIAEASALCFPVCYCIFGQFEILLLPLGTSPQNSTSVLLREKWWI